MRTTQLAGRRELTVRIFQRSYAKALNVPNIGSRGDAVAIGSAPKCNSTTEAVGVEFRPILRAPPR